jgi:Domain of unknown function (DUF5666)
MRKALILIGAVFVVGLVAAGSFWGGMAYQTKQADQARQNFENARGQANAGQIPAGAPGFGGGASGNGSGGQNLGFGGGTVGQVKTVEGATLTLSTAQDVTTVTLSDATQVEKTVSGDLADLQPGMQVMVSGERDAEGNLTASQIRIIDSSLSGFTPPSATGTAP